MAKEKRQEGRGERKRREERGGEERTGERKNRFESFIISFSSK